MRKNRILTFILFLAIIINCPKVMSQQWGMYTFYATQNATQAKLVDTNGTAYKTWALSSATAYSAYLLPNDTILQTVRYQSGSIGQGGITGKVEKLIGQESRFGNMQYPMRPHKCIMMFVRYQMETCY